MKKVLMIVAIALMPMLTMAQADVFEKFERDANVSSMVVGKKTFNMLAETEFKSTDPKAEKGKELFSQIESLRVLSTENAASSAELKAAVGTYAKAAKLEDLIQVKDKGKIISIMVKEGRSENIISEILVFVDGGSKKEETILVSVIGNFDLDQLSEMMETKTVSGDKKADEKQFGAIKDALELKLHPNPTSDVFFINTDKPAEVKLYDLSGRMVKSQTYSSAGISVAGLQPATYVAEVTTGDKKQTQKIVVK